MTNTPVISIVTGTYNRLVTLQRMVQSVRDTLADTVSYEFIIADNASTDGTWDWLQAQDDATVLQMGAPIGAIKAFTEAAKHAQGEYVLLATDDIWFPQYAILKAVRWLEQHPTCGAVAFMHNKSGHFRVDVQKARTIDGEKTKAVYPQISLVRRWLGDVCGWWGGDHPHMQHSFTYGGDNYLGARIVELGYTVEDQPGCVDFEDVIDDGPRALNSERHQNDFDNFWSLYPDGPLIADAPQISNPQRERLRVLLCLHYNPRFPQHKTNKRGMETAFRKLGHVVVYDFAQAVEQGRNVASELGTLAEAWQPHVIWTQVHNSKHGFPVEAVVRMRSNAPKAVCVNWNGDYWPENIEDPATQRMYRLFDLILVQSVYLQERLCELDICSAYMPHSFEVADVDVSAPGYEVIFQGHGYSEFRENLIALLRDLPYQVGLYGRSGQTEMDGETHYDFGLARGIYANSQIAISPMQFDHHTARGFVSNRMWEILAGGGALCLQQYVPMLSEMTGLQDGVHLVYWSDFDDLREKVAYYLTHEDEARRIAQQGYELVHEQHSFDSRIRHVLTEILPEKMTNGDTNPT